MKNHLRYCIAVSFFAIASQAWGAGGYIYSKTGNVYVSGENLVSRAVSLNDTISPGAQVRTGEKSSVVIKFDDGQVVALQPNTVFKVDRYDYFPKRPQESHIFLSMLKGGMRFITGLIGHHHKEGFKLVTPNATMGIRGTDAMVVIGANNVMYGEVVSGGISVTNAAGTAVVTASQSIAVSSMTAMPTVVSANIVPAGTFSQLGSLPMPAPTPPAAEAVGGSTGSGAGAGGAASGGASSAAAGGAAAGGVSATTLAIGAGVAGAAAALGGGATATTTHH